MKQLDIVDLQKTRDNYRFQAHYSPTAENWPKFRDIRNKSKSKIKETKSASYKKYYFSKIVKKYGKCTQDSITKCQHVESWHK